MTGVFANTELIGDIWHLVCFSTWFIEFLEGVLREAILAAGECAGNGMVSLASGHALADRGYS